MQEVPEEQSASNQQFDADVVWQRRFLPSLVLAVLEQQLLSLLELELGLPISIGS